MGVYLGLDSSTQSLKGILIDTEAGELLGSCTANFGADLPEFNCPNGVLANDDPAVNHSDPLMWLAALDRVLGGLQAQGVDLSAVEGVSGSGQQHGSVYLNGEFQSTLAALDPAQDLVTQLRPTLAKPTSPIWMDSSTNAECGEITAAVGDRLQHQSGSPAIERFTGPQIRKIYKTEPAVYESTKVIHLVSSFLASVLAGKSVAIDYGDGAGMNLLNLTTLAWDPEFCEATAPGLTEKLPPVAASSTVAGEISPYFAKYGFRADCKVVIWSGDNPNSLVGMGAGRPGTAVISMGTSDTFFAAMDEMKVDPAGCGHVFGNPAGGFMSMVCFTNGSLAREAVKEECGASWEVFDVTALAES
ncbi:MAG: xylulokinase, partial [Planctomycetota bacterium]